MRRLVITKKSGFTIVKPDLPVIIRDERGVIFYTTEPILPRAKVFNLPVGIYMVDAGYFIPREQPVKFPLMKLPPKQRSFKKPFNFNIEFNRNPHKCTIKWDEKRIVFDNELKEKPRFVLDFILFHEYGHACYWTERYADGMAANYMKLRGYNPSQIGTAPFMSLSSSQYQRKKYIALNV